MCVSARGSFVQAEIYVSSTPPLPSRSPRNQRENVRKLLLSTIQNCNNRNSETIKTLKIGGKKIKK